MTLDHQRALWKGTQTAEALSREQIFALAGHLHAAEVSGYDVYSDQSRQGASARALYLLACLADESSEEKQMQAWFAK